MMTLLTPTRFADWYAHVTNQGAHGGVVGGGAVLACMAVLSPLAAWWAVVVIYLAFEALVQSGFDDDWHLTWDWRDSLDDTANVAWIAALGLSVWRRK